MKFLRNYLQELFGIGVVEEGNYVFISRFPVRLFEKELRVLYQSSRVYKAFERTFSLWGMGTIKVHKFFLPELVYILSQLPPRKHYANAVNQILEDTWMRNVNKDFPSKINSSRLSDFTYQLKGYQHEFLNLYDLKKQQYSLKGYLLAFEQGLGKTFTSLALMHSLNKDAIIIVAPKSTIRTVWQNEIDKIFKQKQNTWVIGDSIQQRPRFFIVNYESIDKLTLVSKYLVRANNVGIIVDECHNFRNANAKRVENLLVIAKHTKCEDILLMSGTPVKALGTEMIPMLQLIDSFFDSESQDIFGKAFGLSKPVALDILKNRLGLMMHRKMKSEVLSLPEKSYHDVQIQIPDGDKYTVDVVKEKVMIMFDERKEHYKSKYGKYENDFNECIEYLKSKLGNNDQFLEYLNVIDALKLREYNKQNNKKAAQEYGPEFIKRVQRANQYEREVLRPMLPSDLKKKFDGSKAVIKYVHLKIMGEIIGGYLSKLRSEMFQDMITHSPICEIVNNSIKKTVCFTTYVDVVRHANKYLKDNCHLNSAPVFGETSGNIKEILNDFKTNEDLNPLVATIQTLSTGVTVVEANTIIFLNKPWRHSDKLQAEDRVHRIGQDTPVDVFTFILDTGEKQNLSTRMEEIVSWSQEMFEGIVGKDEVEKRQVMFNLLRR